MRDSQYQPGSGAARRVLSPASPLFHRRSFQSGAESRRAPVFGLHKRILHRCKSPLQIMLLWKIGKVLIFFTPPSPQGFKEKNKFIAAQGKTQASADRL